MARVARLKFSEQDSWYHVHARIAGHKGDYCLSEGTPTRKLLATIKHFSAIYFCDVAAFCVMGTQP